MRLLLFLLLLPLSACGPKKDLAATDAVPEPIADVDVRIVREGPIRKTFEGYGTAVAEPGSAQTYTVPFEGIVQSVSVAAGQAVGAGTVLARLAPSIVTQSGLEQSQIDLAAQRAALQTTQERFDLHLATRQEREAAQASVSAAQARVNALQRADSRTSIVARASGVVDTVFVSPGQTVGPGAPLVAISGDGGFTVTLGVEAEELPLISAGQSVTLSAVDRPELRVLGRVRRVEQALNARTRLAQVIIAISGANPFLLGEYIRGTFDGAEERALIAPRDALLPTPEGLVVYTVRNGRAVRHVARIVVESDSLTGFQADGVSAGDSLIVSGLVQLSDSLRIRLRR